ncbi:MAG: hypothetical protein AVDCRST_MAG77-1592, partial [uncultured Chloroflexi bacterium]
ALDTPDRRSGSFRWRGGPSCPCAGRSGGSRVPVRRPVCGLAAPL